MKKFTSGLIIGIIIASLSIGFAGNLTAYYNDEIRLMVDGEFLNVTPVTAIESGQTNGFNLFPVRTLGVALGYNVAFDNKTKIISLDKPSIQNVAKNVEGCVLIRTYSGNKHTASGSGVIYDGKIITNAHVLDAGTKYTVEYEGSTRTYSAERIKINTDFDIAILKSPLDKKSVTVGDSSKVKVGDEVVLISSPRELKNTVTNGKIVSIRTYDADYFHTSAISNDGSSGGGLFDINGSLIGILQGKLEDGTSNIAYQIDDIIELVK